MLQVDPPTPEEAALVEDRTLISLLFPAQSGDLVKQLEGQKATVMAMDQIPRTLSRGQTYDALSSQVQSVDDGKTNPPSSIFGRGVPCTNDRVLRW